MVVVVVLLLALALFLWLPTFRVYNIVIRGVGRIDPDRITAAVAVEPGTHMWLKVDLEKLAEQVVSVQGIDAAAVSRSLPSRLVVEVLETAAVARVAGDGGQYLVDVQGVVLGRASGDALAGLPLIRGDMDVESGQAIGSEYGPLLAVAAAVVALELEVDYIDYCGDRGAVLMVDGVRVFAGFSRVNVVDRLMVLPHILSDAREQGFDLEYVDVSSLGRPLIKIRGEEDNEEQE